MNDLLGVWGSSKTDVYAVGASGTLLHSAGDGTWSAEVVPDDTVDLWAVAGRSASDVYVVGTFGTVLRGHSGCFSPLDNPGDDYYSAWADANNIWIGGVSVQHGTGGPLTTEMVDPTGPLINSITGLGGKVWAAGDVWNLFQGQ
jgi:hypothetical protein